MAFLKPIEKKKLKPEATKREKTIGIIIGSIIILFLVIYLPYKMATTAQNTEEKEFEEFNNVSEYNTSKYQSIKIVCDNDICRYYGELK